MLVPLDGLTAVRQLDNLIDTLICTVACVMWWLGTRLVFTEQVRQFLEGALQYADVIAVALGLPPVPEVEGALSTPEFSLVGAVVDVAHAAIATIPRSQGDGRHGTIDKESDAGRWRVNVVGFGEGRAKSDSAGTRSINVMVVTPWGKFTPALNALLSFAARDLADLVLFQVRRNAGTLER